MGCGFRKGGFSVTEILAAIASGLTELRAKTTAGVAVKDSAGTTVATLCPTGEGILPNTIKAPTTSGMLIKDSAGTTVATLAKTGQGAEVNVLKVLAGTEGFDSFIRGGDSESDGLLRIENGAGTWIENDLVVDNDLLVGSSISVTNNIVAGLLSRTPILPPWDDSANPVLTAADTGGVFVFGGTATLPDPATLPDGWCAELVVLAGGFVQCSAGSVVFPDVGTASTYESAGGGGLRLVQSGGGYYVSSSVGSFSPI